jgi:hypothetical protein
MKTAKALAILLALLLLPVSMALAWDTEWYRPKPVTYDVAVDFWMEKFEGGFPGQQGNTLFAAGPGFIFQNALLSHVDSSTPPTFPTTYIGGQLILDSPGPWARHGKLVATGITALNVAKQSSFPGPLEFTLTFGGKFDNDPDLCFKVEAKYAGTPKVVNLYGFPILQKDTALSAKLTAWHCRK